MVNEKVNKYLFFVILVVYVITQLDYLFLDFWNDEIYSVKEFVLVPIHKTLTDYHSTNNHIFFNLINNLYCKLVGIKTLKDVFEHTIALRIIPFLYSIITLYFTYHLCEKYIFKNSGFIVGVVLVFCIPFHNFALQLRGYGMSIMFISLLLYLVFDTLYELNKKKLLSISVVTCLLFYNLTINLLFLVALGFILLISVFYQVYKGNECKKQVQLIIAVIVGVLCGVLLYLPSFQDVFSDSFVEPSSATFPFNMALINVVFLSFLSKQYIVLFLAIAGGILMVKNKENKLLSILGGGGVVLFLPFILSMILTVLMHQRAFERIFVNLVVIYAILVGVSVTYLLSKISFQAISKSVILIVLGITFYFQKQRISNHLINESVRGQGLYFNYYQAHFSPLEQVKLLVNETKESPIFVVDSEFHGFTNYLKAFDVDYTWSTPQQVVDKLNGESYIVTSHPTQIINEIQQLNSTVKCIQLSERGNYNSVIKVYTNQ